MRMVCPDVLQDAGLACRDNSSGVKGFISKLAGRCDYRAKRDGLTILELVISLGLISILAGVSFWAINPIERLKQGRDAQRITDLETVRKAIDSAVSSGAHLGNTFGVPSSSAAVGATQKTDGSGWVPMNLSSKLATLPVDPVNGRTLSDVLGSKVLGEYQFISDGVYYVLRTHLEAEVNRDKYAKDGNDNSWYEVGTAPGLSTYFGL